MENNFLNQFKVLQRVFLPATFRKRYFVINFVYDVINRLWLLENFCMFKLGSSKEYLYQILNSSAIFLHFYFQLALYFL